MRISSQRHTKRPRQSEIRLLQIPLFINQQILGLQITMQNAMRMAVSNPRDQLIHEALDHISAQGKATRNRLHVLLKIQVEELKD